MRTQDVCSNEVLCKCHQICALIKFSDFVAIKRLLRWEDFSVANYFSLLRRAFKE